MSEELMEIEDEESESSSFALLDKRVQNWVWQKQWTRFRDVQEQAIPAILKQESDVILAASTSSGKTEAAFLPVISKMLKNFDITAGEENNTFGLCIYISPLTALINDQLFRVTEMCENLQIPVHPWHGGISAGVKKCFFQNPEGILLITPESLQSVFCNYGFDVHRLFCNTMYIVVDELHSFIGSERGKQLQTLLHLMDVRAKKNITRIGLSATLGDMNLAADFLSVGGSQKRKNKIIVSNDKRTKMQLILKGITENETIINSSKDNSKDNTSENNSETKEIALHAAEHFTNTLGAPLEIAKYIFLELRGKNTLIFPNSRSKVEHYTYLLSSLCSANGVPNEYYAHHGNLSKNLRNDAEDALRDNIKSATVICTNTLEMGIDIGSITNVVQIDPPPSVASLRQRVGRSGRRDDDASILHAFVTEETINENSHLCSALRENTFQFCATIQLMLEGWCEPPEVHGMHLSALVQQLLSIICERGGILQEDAYEVLCETGAFTEVNEKDFAELLTQLESLEIIEKDRVDFLLLGARGEKLTSHFAFYAAFNQRAEYRIISETTFLGTLPVNSNLQIGDYIIFAGKAWTIKEINPKKHIIEVEYFEGGHPPVFYGSGFSIHTMIRKRMRSLYESSEIPIFADSNTKQLLKEGRSLYKKLNLNKNTVIQSPDSTVLLTWMGDKANRALHVLLKHYGMYSYTSGIGLTFQGKTPEEVNNILRYLKKSTIPAPEKLLHHSQTLNVEKWDKFLPPKLCIKNYISMYLSMPEAKNWIANML
ncbi:MAG: DEAD/DEAH box helicase [Spirochaetaceae bacterium]|jgi:ATP-dependent Lhr-like helicase|nr:DEAD/DEAH box helicase [Spirochaetaceae bacterium]